MDGTERSGTLQAVLTRGPLRNRTVASMTVVGAFALLGVSILAAGSLKSGDVSKRRWPKSWCDYRNAARYTPEYLEDLFCRDGRSVAVRTLSLQSVTRFTGAKA